MPYVGQLAALSTALLWAVCALSFEAAGRRIGSMTVNLVRLVMAWGMFAVYGLVMRGLALPTDATGEMWLWLGLSGLVGFFLGDLCLFRAFLLIGPRLALLIMSLAPPMTALIGWAALGERLTVWNWLGMGITLAGVSWVVSERKVEAAVSTWKVTPWGVLLALIGAAGQAVGMVLAKKGLGDYDPFAAAQIRVTSAIAGFALLFVALRWYPRVFRSLRDGRAMALTAFGAAVGPFVGVSLLLFSLKHLPSGLAQTFVATMPVIVLPLTIVVYKERVSLRAWLGVGLAVGGVAMLFLAP